VHHAFQRGKSEYRTTVETATEKPAEKPGREKPGRIYLINRIDDSPRETGTDLFNQSVVIEIHFVEGKWG